MQVMPNPSTQVTRHCAKLLRLVGWLHWTERSAARLAHQSGGLGVPSSNLGAPTNNYLITHSFLLWHSIMLPYGIAVEAIWKR